MHIHHETIGILNNASIKKILENGYRGHLGCASKDEVYIVPITYALDDGYIYAHSKNGKKIKMMRKNPKVCLQVEEVDNLFKWKSVIVRGTFEELKNTDASRGMRLLIKHILEKESHEYASTMAIDLEAVLEKAIVFRIKIESVGGRFEDQSNLWTAT